MPCNNYCFQVEYESGCHGESVQVDDNRCVDHHFGHTQDSEVENVNWDTESNSSSSSRQKEGYDESYRYFIFCFTFSACMIR